VRAKYKKDQCTERFLMLFHPAQKKAAMKAASDAEISLGEYVRRAVAYALEHQTWPPALAIAYRRSGCHLARCVRLAADRTNVGVAPREQFAAAE
jgi:hypothetical protein